MPLKVLVYKETMTMQRVYEVICRMMQIVLCSQDNFDWPKLLNGNQAVKIIPVVAFSLSSLSVLPPSWHYSLPCTMTTSLWTLMVLSLSVKSTTKSLLYVLLPAPVSWGVDDKARLSLFYRAHGIKASNQAPIPSESSNEDLSAYYHYYRHGMQDSPGKLTSAQSIHLSHI